MGLTNGDFREDFTTPHRHSYKFSRRMWNGHETCLSWFCRTCPDGARSSRIIPVATFWAGAR